MSNGGVPVIFKNLRQLWRFPMVYFRLRWRLTATPANWSATWWSRMTSLSKCSHSETTTRSVQIYVICTFVWNETAKLFRYVLKGPTSNYIWTRLPTPDLLSYQVSLSYSTHVVSSHHWPLFRAEYTHLEHSENQKKFFRFWRNTVILTNYAYPDFLVTKTQHISPTSQSNNTRNI